MTVSSIHGDIADLATIEVDRSFTVAYNQATRPLKYYVVFVKRGRVTKVEPFTKTAGEKRKHLAKLGIDLETSNYAIIAEREDGTWLEPCGNQELFKHLPQH